MEIELLERGESLTRIALRGRLDTPGVDRIETRLNAMLARGGNVLLELGEVTFLSSLGIRLLLGAAKQVARGSGKLVLVSPAPLVAQALKHSSLEEIIPVAPDLASARTLLEA